MSHADWIFDRPQSYLSLRYAPPRTLCMPTPHATWGSTTCCTSSLVVAPDDATSPCGDAAACTSSAFSADFSAHGQAQGLQHTVPTSSLAIPPMYRPPASLRRRRPGERRSPSLSFPLSRHPLSPSASPSASSSIGTGVSTALMRSLGREGWCPHTLPCFGVPADAVPAATSRGTAARARTSGRDKCRYPGCGKKYHRARALFSLVWVRRRWLHSVQNTVLV
ncbi:hypothetical protein B0H13DRAFT_2315156 [Mycena leptocephala]|nr:hypothetical protein B0H13DRAFT_2315156 [Mycena leptocephala]